MPQWAITFLSPYLHPMSSVHYSKLCKSPHQCRMCIGLYTLSSRRVLCMGCHIMKGVYERCIARLFLTLDLHSIKKKETKKRLHIVACIGLFMSRFFLILSKMLGSIGCANLGLNFLSFVCLL